MLVDSADGDLPRDAFDYPYAPSTATTTEMISISGGNSYLDADFGFKPLGAIGDRIWQDNNGNGNQDAGEPGISGVTVGLYAWTDVNGDGVYDAAVDALAPTPLTTDVTDSGGLYSFTGLHAGDYVVLVSGGIPAGFSQSGDPDWLEPCTGTGLCDGASGVALRTGQVDMSRDFGYRPSGVIGDFVWFDADADGVQDAGEGGIGYVTVQLCADAACNTVLATTQTDSDGHYSFGNLGDGTYYVRVESSTLPAGLAPTYDLDGGTTTPNSLTVVILSDGSNLEADFGYRAYDPEGYGISGTVFYDAGSTGDGTNDTYGAVGDVPYANITVYLWRDGSIIAQTMTDSNGFYSFGDLPAGTYTVSVDRGDTLGAMDVTASPNAGRSFTTVTLVNSDVVNQDFGFHAAIDYGDLPDTYGTTVGNNGAGHITGDLKLGIGINTEADGKPGAMASGDDFEDGITFGIEAWEAGKTVSLNATVSGSNGVLVGWFDWDGDGKFSVGEMVSFGDVVNGPNTLSLKVPDDAANSVAFIYMRFRLYDKATLVGISPTGLASNGEVEDYRHSWTPTAVDLIRFEAAVEGEAVRITWETATEIDNLGFNLYRSATASGPWVHVNAELIPAQNPGAVFGAVYEVLDMEVTPGVPVYYRLEDIDVHGASTFHGPISITPSAPSAATVVGFAAQGISGLGLLLAAAFGLVTGRRLFATH